MNYIAAKRHKRRKKENSLSLLSGTQIARHKTTKLRPAEAADRTRILRKNRIYAGLHPAFYPPHPQNPRSTGGKPYAQLELTNSFSAFVAIFNATAISVPLSNDSLLCFLRFFAAISEFEHSF